MIFVSKNDGSTALLTAIGMALCVLLGGLVLNVSRSYHQQAWLKQASDAAALAGAVEYLENQDVTASKALALKYLQANVYTTNVDNSIDDIAIDTSNGKVTVSPSGAVSTYLYTQRDAINTPVQSAAMASVDRLLSGSSEGSLELALALDVTKSMGQGGKMGALRDATGSLIDRILTASPEARIALVPFNHTVRLNMQEHGEYSSWLDSELYNRFVAASNLAPNAAAREAWQGCIINNLPPNDVLDTPLSAAPLVIYNKYAFKVDAHFNYPSVNHAYLSIDDEYKKRRSPYFHFSDENNTKNPNYKPSSTTLDNITVQKNQACDLPVIVPLSNDKAYLQSFFSSNATYKDSGYGAPGWGESGTIGSFGLNWAWRAISPQWQGKWPASSPSVPSAYGDINKAIVFLTDGVSEMPALRNGNGSTHSGYGAYGIANRDMEELYRKPYDWRAYGINTSSLDAADLELDSRLRQVCANIKAKDIALYTVAFDVIGQSAAVAQRANQTLKTCATDDSHYYTVENASDLKLAFDEIADTIAEGIGADEERLRLVE